MVYLDSLCSYEKRPIFVDKSFLESFLPEKLPYFYEVSSFESIKLSIKCVMSFFMVLLREGKWMLLVNQSYVLHVLEYTFFS